MKPTHTRNLIKAISFITIGIAIAVGGIHVGDTGDAPGVSLISILIMIGMVIYGVKTAQRKP